MFRVDNKYSIADGRLVKTSNGVPLDTSEPLFILRAKDQYAIRLLSYYLALCAKGKVEHVELIEKTINEFNLWRQENPEKVKVPD
jgi:hypothetical protein